MTSPHRHAWNSRARCHTAPVTAACAVLALLLAAGAHVGEAATYKWTDEKGVVHYTDKMPPEAMNRGNVELSRDGVPMRKVDPPLTPEQRRAREQEEERKRQVARQQEDIARRDRALLASYATEGEIDLARVRAVNTIDAVLQSSAAYTEQLNRRKVELGTRVATYKKGPVPPVLERELEAVNEELTRQAELVTQKRQEIGTITARYDADKTRFRELSAKAAEAGASAGVPAATRTSSPAASSTGTVSPVNRR